MSGKICESCGERFEPSRAVQRFCSTRCANRQRDRRRRQGSKRALPAPGADVALNSGASASPHPERPHSAETRIDAALARRNSFQESLQAQLRFQAVDSERLAADNAELRGIIKSLRVDLDRSRSVHTSDSQELVHLAGKLLALARATGLELDSASKAIFRRRGWTATGRHQEARKR
ncbi:hypothetical protein [Arthrobacter zhaoguopingii]|uniref:hypothetical protein n=1 Tax=Arthrobacter zhaoguopingii TaxID=2681491 RepID=UPI00135AE421|nr:hypothetical protein [Arthrobacter zhaoguopingii]